MISTLIHDTLTILSALFVLALGLSLLGVIALFIIDSRQTRSAIRRNYPVIGRFRYFFEHLGEFFRQYFFAMDREELPFNRALRSWVYRASKGVSTTLAFGSSRNVNTPGEPHFLNSAFPVLEEEAQDAPAIEFGPTCKTPYVAQSFFNISAMSYGALSKPAVKALSHGAARAGCWLNTGEGGLSAHHLSGNGDIVFQIGTAKYGVRDEHGKLCLAKLKALGDNPCVKMFEVKLSQGAKPGKGGILPGKKVTPEIAEIRGIPVGQSSISPNRHIELETTEDLLNMVHTIRETTGKPCGIKFVLGDSRWLEELCTKIKDLGNQFAPDFITIDSADGGSGAAPQPLLDFVGLPLKESLPALTEALNKHQLRDRIKIIASGKLITPSAVAFALARGADAVVSARGFMFALGCIQAMQCNKNTCPTGVTTHNPRLQKGLDPTNKSVRVSNYHRQMVHDVNLIAHSCGAPHAGALSPHHVRIVGTNGLSQPL